MAGRIVHRLRRAVAPACRCGKALRNILFFSCQAGHETERSLVIPTLQQVSDCIAEICKLRRLGRIRLRCHRIAFFAYSSVHRPLFNQYISTIFLLFSYTKRHFSNIIQNSDIFSVFNANMPAGKLPTGISFSSIIGISLLLHNLHDYFFAFF